MLVLSYLSRCLNVLAILSVVLLVSVTVSSLTLADNRGVRFPDDKIVFPSGEGKEKRSEHYKPAYFQHNPEFHKMHPHLPNPVERTGHSYRPSFQHNSEFHKHDNEQVLEYNNESLSTIPLDFIQSINKFNDSEILLNFVDGGDRIDVDPSILTDRFGSGERNAAVTPKSAGCMPELQTVKLASSNDASVLYIPQCTRLERCGGCCSHHLLSCQPSDVQPVSFSVMKTQYVGGKKLKFLGKEIVVMEKHTKCKCDCRVKEEDCNRFQQYKKSECRCACINNDEEKKCYSKNQTKLWDPELCSCVCREVTPCSTGFQFDPIECRCSSKPTRNRYSEANPRLDYEK